MQRQCLPSLLGKVTPVWGNVPQKLRSYGKKYCSVFDESFGFVFHRNMLFPGKTTEKKCVLNVVIKGKWKTILLTYLF